MEGIHNAADKHSDRNPKENTACGTGLEEVMWKGMDCVAPVQERIQERDFVYNVMNKQP
jgi:hypothetical protein